MKKFVYLLAIFTGIGILFYFYILNFNTMSETELVESVLYWYIPLVSGLYGLTALRIYNTYDETSKNVISHIFSGNDKVLFSLVITIFVLGGGVGILLFIIPLLIFKPHWSGYDLSVSVSGALIWLVFLYLFFEIIWPSL